MELIDISNIPYPRDSVTGKVIPITPNTIANLVSQSLSESIVHCTIIGNVSPLLLYGGSKSASIIDLSNTISNEGGIDITESKRKISFTNNRGENVGEFLSTSRIADMGKYFQLTTETYQI